MLIIAKDRYLCTLNKAFFSIMQNKTDKETLLVSKSLPVVNLNSVNHLFSTKKKKYYVVSNEWSKENCKRAKPTPFRNWLYFWLEVM